MSLDNTNRRLLEGVVLLLRDKVSGWSNNAEYSTDNVWSKGVPEEVNEEFPRGVVDITAGNDFDLSIDLDVRLREVFLKITVFAETALEVEDLIEDSESAIRTYSDQTAQSPKSNWTVDTYFGDWSVREVDGFTETVENEESEGKLRYNRSIDMVVETVKTN